MINLNSSQRQMDLVLGNAGFGTDFSFADTYIDGYWGAALNKTVLDDTINGKNTAREDVIIDLDREIITLQGSLGIFLRITDSFEYAPYLTLNFSTIETDAQFLKLNTSTGTIDSEQFSASTDAITTSLNQDLSWEMWSERGRIELNGSLVISYTDTTDNDYKNLDTFGLGYSAIVGIRYSEPTAWRWNNKRWWWNTYYQHINLLNQDKISMGFKYYNEVGIGIEYEALIKPLDLFGLRYIGFKIGGIVGDDVTGASIGLTFR